MLNSKENSIVNNYDRAVGAFLSVVAQTLSLAAPLTSVKFKAEPAGNYKRPQQKRLARRPQIVLPEAPLKRITG